MPEYIELSSLFLPDFNRVTLRVSDHECFAEPELSVLIPGPAHARKIAIKPHAASASDTTIAV
jgi:hypothetical protein